MMHKLQSSIRPGAALALAACLAAPAAAQQPSRLPDGYPSKPVRFLVGSTAGGGLDLIARPVAQKLTERWGRPVVVDNRPGGATLIAMDLTAQAAPDGYTFMVASSTIILNAALKKVTYDIRKAYTPVAQMTSQMYLLVVVPSLPVRTVKDLVALARSKPGSINYASAGLGSVQHLGMERFNAMAGINMVHVPYKGSGAALIDLLGGQVQTMYTSTISGASHVRSGKLRAIAISGLKRAQAYPDLPTVSESGVPGYELTNSYCLYGPAGIAPAIVVAINREVGEIVNSPDMKSALEAEGTEAAEPKTPAQFREYFYKEVTKWEQLLKDPRIKL